MGRDPGGKEPWLPKKKEGEAMTRRDRGGIELWEVKGTHSSFGKNPPTTILFPKTNKKQLHDIKIKHKEDFTVL